MLLSREGYSMLTKRLIHLRKKNKKTQQDISDIIGVSRPAYTAYEKGTRTPDYKILKTLAGYYGVTTDYLLGNSDIPNIPKESGRDKIINKIASEFPDIDLMFEDMKNMSADDLQEVYEFIKFKKSQKNNL